MCQRRPRKQRGIPLGLSPRDRPRDAAVALLSSLVTRDGLETVAILSYWDCRLGNRKMYITMSLVLTKVSAFPPRSAGTTNQRPELTSLRVSRLRRQSHEQPMPATPERRAICTRGMACSMMRLQMWPTDAQRCGRRRSHTNFNLCTVPHGPTLSANLVSGRPKNP
jgi:hypothetical protein